MRQDDGNMLVEILSWSEAYPEKAEKMKVPVREFTSMLDRGYTLTDKQAAWVHNVYEKIFDVPKYQNLVSSGKVPRGKEVPTPEVLKHLPKKPPPLPKPVKR